MSLVLALRRHRRVDLRETEATLVYILSFKSAGATGRLSQRRRRKGEGDLVTLGRRVQHGAPASPVCVLLVSDGGWWVLFYGQFQVAGLWILLSCCGSLVMFFWLQLITSHSFLTTECGPHCYSFLFWRWHRKPMADLFVSLESCCEELNK